MSYRLVVPQHVRYRDVPQRPTLLPLAQVQPEPPGLTRAQKLLIAAVVIVIVLAVAYWLYRRFRKPVRRNRATRTSTAEMARQLHRRLEERGGVSETTLRSLAQLARKA